MYEVWRAVRERLSLGNFTKLLLGAGRIFVATDEYPPMQDQLDRPWGRLVVIPVVTAWVQKEEAGRHVLAPFLVRSDYHRPDGSRFDVDRWNDAAQAEAFQLLHGWGPVTDMAHALIEHPVCRYSPPQTSSIWDPERRVYSKSSTYHVYVSPPAWEG